MALVLKSMGAKVSGFSLPPEDDRGIFVAANVADDVHHHLGDIRDYDSLRTSLGEAEPSVVIHMRGISISSVSNRLNICAGELW